MYLQVAVVVDELVLVPELWRVHQVEERPQLLCVFRGDGVIHERRSSRARLDGRQKQEDNQ